MQNFGKIKTAFNDLLANGIGKKDDSSKALFKKYIKTIKESKILRTQFLVYNNIENRVDEDLLSAIHFVQENINLLNSFKASDIQTENQKLLALSDKLVMNESYELSKVHESLGNLIGTKRTPSNIDSLTNEVKTVAEYIKNNKPKEITESIDLPRGMFSTLVVDKFNEKYSTLSENDRSIIKALHNSSDANKNEVYKTTINECVDLINKQLTESSDIDTKGKLLMVKDKLLNDKENAIPVDFISEIAKLAELKSTLIKN